MQIHDLVLLLNLAAAHAGKAELPMPPPPAGYTLLHGAHAKASGKSAAQANAAVPAKQAEPSASTSPATDASQAADTKAAQVPAANAKVPEAPAAAKPADAKTPEAPVAAKPADAKPADAKAALDAPAPAKPAADADDDSGEEPMPDLDEPSAELEQMRALEQAALDPQARPNAEILKTIRRLGLGNPLRRQIQDACEEPELREDNRPYELPQITDLASFDVGLVKDEYDIPVEMQPLVAQYIQFFQGPGRKWFRYWMGRSTKYIPLMQAILEQRGLPKDTVYLAMIESGFAVNATSWAKAVGPWQFIAGTAKRMGLKVDFWVDERRDPIKATEAAARYLGELHEDLGHWYLAWAGYNTGGGRVRKMMELRGTSDFWQLSEGKGFATETKHYVPKLIACALVAKHYKAFGFQEEEFQFQPRLEFDEVKVTSATDLEVIARAAGVPAEQVYELNPELKRFTTPPATEDRPYMVRIPKGTAITFAQNFAKIAPKERLTFRIHKVKKGDTLSRIAAQYKTAPEAILQFNRLRNARALKINTELAIPVPSAHTTKLAEAAVERQAAQARRNGYVASRPDEEIPAGTPPRKAKGQADVATGKLSATVVNGRTRISYGVREGDSLWSIGQEFNCSVDDLQKWNGLAARSRNLKVGTVLAIWQDAPQKGQAQARATPAVAKDVKPAVQTAAQPQPQKVVAAAGGKRLTHQLAAGETLWSVAQRYGVTVEDLMRWNGITNHRTVKAGQQLTLVAR